MFPCLVVVCVVVMCIDMCIELNITDSSVRQELAVPARWRAGQQARTGSRTDYQPVNCDPPDRSH